MDRTLNPPAFPQHPQRYVDTGMDLRDYFAAAALPFAWQQFLNPESVDFRHIAKEAYQMADAMLETRLSTAHALLPKAVTHE